MKETFAVSFNLITMHIALAMLLNGIQQQHLVVKNQPAPVSVAVSHQLTFQYVTFAIKNYMHVRG